MDWKFNNSSPVYQQIMEKILSAVLAGEFSPGEKIPSVRDLAVEARVNPNTVQHALQELEQTGLLVTRSTNGRHVTDDETILESMRNKRLRELTEEFMGKFATLGVPPSQVMQLLSDYEKERNEK